MSVHRHATFAIMLVGLGLMTGCSPQYGCALKNETSYCASVREAYGASVNDGGDDESVFSGRGQPQAGRDAQVSAPPVAWQAAGGAMAPPGSGQPVYDPGSPWRVWVAPWTDAEGILHGGNYIYFATPPRWNYGSLRAPGAASGLLGPLRPDDLGFVTTDDPYQAPMNNGVVQPYQPWTPGLPPP